MLQKYVGYLTQTLIISCCSCLYSCFSCVEYICTYTSKWWSFKSVTGLSWWFLPYSTYRNKIFI